MDQSTSADALPKIGTAGGSRAAPMAAAPAPPSRGRRRPFIILALILGAIALGCIAYWVLNRGYATTDDAEIDGDIYTISPRVAGLVATVNVGDNQHVAAGQVLVTLDPRDQQVAVARAIAQAAEANAQLQVATADAAEATANVTQAQASLAQAQQDFNRYRSVNPHAITQQTLDAATATIRAARAKFAAMQADAQGAAAQVTAAEANLRAAQVAVDDARLQLSYTAITAPAAGHVAQKTVEPGNVVAPGTGLMALVGDNVWVTANYKETQLAGIRPGAPATVTVDAVPGVTFKAHVDSIQYGTGSVFSLLPAENATGNYVKIIQRVPVKIVFDDPRIADYPLAPGMSVLPSITIQK
jgi:membrane fusion protein (multidrug efflux system)